MKKYYLLILVIILNNTLSYADSDLKSRIGAASSSYLASHFMNAAYMFCDADGVIDKGAKGIHSLTSKKELQPLQQMPIASATKTMTAAGILRLQDKNLLDVQDTVAKHLSARSGIWKDGKIPAWAEQVRIHNLLTHRSGLPEYFMAIELDVKKPHAEINKDGDEPQFNAAKSKFLMVPFADGGVVSTTYDLIVWHQALHSGKVISGNTYNLMTTRHYEVADRTGVNNYIGYGLYISELEGGDILYHHAGSAVAIRSESGCIPKKNICFAVLSNVMDYIPKEMKDKVDLDKAENQLDIYHFVQHILKAIR